MAGTPDETILRPKNLALSVLFDKVFIEIACSGEYGAQVLFDDLQARYNAGQGIVITPGRSCHEQ